MGHLDNELTQLRGNLIEMFLLVQKQLSSVILQVEQKLMVNRLLILQ